jgi:hypothetical protein
VKFGSYGGKDVCVALLVLALKMEAIYSSETLVSTYISIAVATQKTNINEGFIYSLQPVPK